MKRQTFFLKMITSSLMRRRSRMFVALFAVSVGATILSGLITIYRDIPRQMGQEFRSYGANLLLVPSGGAAGITDDGLARAAEILSAEDVVGVAPYRYHTAKINEQPFMVAGTELAEARKTSPYWLVTGAWPDAAGEALLGQGVADAIRLPVGSVFTLTDADGAGFDFTVTGVVQTGGTEEAFVFLSLADFTRVLGGGGLADVAECSVSASESALTALARKITDDVPGVTARLVKRVTQSEGAVLGKLQALVYLVTAIVLLLTMICVATTMMAVVTERRREIGLKKALGASNNGIVREFLGEGLFLGGVGGLLGAGFGVVFAQLVSVNVFGRAVAFQPLLIPLTLAVSVVITGLACFLPVRAATDVDPAIVLRGE
ncbi:MAG: ABC transporter permease [Oscillospiraceae bacterium]|nr:ABC transporter permease [Oscillospiraceae bacterium]